MNYAFSCKHIPVAEWYIYCRVCRYQQKVISAIIMWLFLLLEEQEKTFFLKQLTFSMIQCHNWKLKTYIAHCYLCKWIIICSAFEQYKNYSELEKRIFSYRCLEWVVYSFLRCMENISSNIIYPFCRIKTIFSWKMKPDDKKRKFQKRDCIKPD